MGFTRRILIATIVVLGTPVAAILILFLSTRHAAELDASDRRTTMRVIERIHPLAPAARIVQGDQSSARSWIVATLPLSRRSEPFDIGSAMIDPDDGMLHAQFRAGGPAAELDMTAESFGREVQKRALAMTSGEPQTDIDP
jgi:hypothetical protein